MSIILFVILIVAILGFSYAYYEGGTLKIREKNYVHPNIPETFVGQKIVFVTDIHFGKTFGRKSLSHLVNKVNQQDADIVLLGGDYVVDKPEYMDIFFEEISKLKSRKGIFFVMGNHDHWENPTEIHKKMQEVGFLSCDNQSYWIAEGKDKIKIGGVGDLWEDEQLINKTISDVEQSDFCILLSHNPDYLELLESTKVDLMLSGHTHAGQVTFFGLWAPIMPSLMHPEQLQTGQKYRYGWKCKEDIDLYVCSGSARGDFPFRFFAPPEILVLTLR